LSRKQRHTGYKLAFSVQFYKPQNQPLNLPWMQQRFAPIIAPDAPDGIVIDSTGTEHLPPTARCGVSLTRSGSPPTSSSPTTDRRSQSPGLRSGRLIHLD
jgi:hypothetical protein